MVSDEEGLQPVTDEYPITILRITVDTLTTMTAHGQHSNSRKTTDLRHLAVSYQVRQRLLGRPAFPKNEKMEV